MLAEARIGTTGFSYREWAGRAYPAGLTPLQMLAYYSSQLSGVELAPPKLPGPDILASWAAAVPSGFQFAVRYPGHVDFRSGKAVAKGLGELLECVEPLGMTLGPILIQVPSTVTADRHVLADLLRAAPSELRLAFEFRHPTWNDESTLRLLSAHEAALVLSDHGEGPPRLAVTAGFTYVRIRRDDDQPDVWTEWADRLATIVRRGVDVYGFLKHDRKGVSFDRARRLAMLLTAEEGTASQQLLLT
ncbi:MAG: DUF72 domain-containing protein [Deltaproteobacteria bacterium]|nr:MAG: DUF72 domain-containing protein [Deltaproteobacteria bacterium]TMB34219.1 MAG: DUF72 domain-containing protein [Deltaproteobacteria bacterium]